MPGKFIEVNDAATQKLGYSKDELLNMTPLDIIQKEIENAPKNALKLLEEGSSKFEAVHIAKDGSKIPVEVNTHLFKLKGKKVILGISRDISERKRAEEELKKSEAYYKTIFENTGTASVIVEEDSTVSLVNAEFEKLWGYSKEEVENEKKWQEFVADDYIQNMEEYHNLRRINPELAPRTYEFKFIDKYDNVKDVLMTIAMIPGTKKSLASILDITDKKIAENALRESEARLRVAMDLAKIVSWEYDVESDMFTFDDHFYALYGTTVKEAGGMQMSPEEYARRFIPPEESFLVAEETTKALKTDDPNFFRQVEHSIIRADGEKRFITVRYGIIKDDKGRTIKTYGANQDITELKKAQEAIIKSRDYLDKIINSIADPVLVKDETHRWVLLNDAYCQFMGYSREELLFKSDYDFFPPNEADVFWNKDEEVLKTGKENVNEEEFTDSNNDVHTIVTKKTLYEDISGEKYIVGIIRDITELKTAEKQKIRHLNKLNTLNKIIVTANRSNDIESLLNNVLNLTLELMNFDGGGIYLIDENTQVAEIICSKGLPGDFLKTVDNIQIDEYPYSEVFINGKSMFMDRYDKLRPEYSKWHLKSGASVPIYSKNKIIGAFNLVNLKIHDFTKGEKKLIKAIGREIGNTIARLITDEEMKSLIKELKHSNDELEQFAYITSHDLQEPLRTIASFTQLLQMRYKGQLDSDADEFMGYMVDASIRMKKMIQGLLNYSRIGKEGMDLKQINFEHIVDEALSNLKLVIEENNAVITYDKLPLVIGDRKLLVQLLQNLIINAIKFKGEKSPEIHISARKSEKEDKYIISVEDNGIGIDPQYADRIFKVFKRLHTLDEYEGAGIGLSIAKRIVENHGGRIWVESELNKGSKFYFTLKSY